MPPSSMPPSSSAGAIFQQCIFGIVTPAAGSLAQQRADLVLIIAFIAGFVAVMHVAHGALAIDDHRARHARDFIQRTDLALRVEQYRKRDRSSLEESKGVRGFRFDVHAQQRETRGLVLAIQLIEYR